MGQTVLWIRFLANFRPMALYLERGMIFEILLNEYFRYFSLCFHIFVPDLSDVLCKT